MNCPLFNVDAVAFVEKKSSVQQSLKVLSDMGFSRLLVISEDMLNVEESVAGGQIKYRLLAEFRTKDLDRKVKKVMDRSFNDWVAGNPRVASIVDEFFGLQTLKYSLWAKWFYAFRKILLIKHISGHANVKIIMCDNYWRIYCELSGTKSILVEEKSPRSSNRAPISSCMKDWLVIAREGLARILFPVVYCSLRREKWPGQSKDMRLLLVGSGRTISSFSGIWKIIKEQENAAMAAEFWGREALFSHNRRTGMPIMEYIAGIKDGLYCLKDYLKIANAMRKGVWDFPFAFESEKSAYFIQETRMFLFAIAASMSLYARVARLLSENFPNLKRVIICTISPQSRALGHCLERYGIESVAATHGMALEPFGYITDSKLTLTWGDFDSKLLSQYSDDTKYCSLWGTGNSIEDEVSSKNEKSRLTAKDVYCWHPGRENCEKMDVLLEGHLGILFPTSNLSDGIIQKILEIGFDFFEEYSRKHRIRFIVIKLKKHPRMKLDVYCRFVDERFKEGFAIPVLISEKLEIGPLLKMSAFGFCYHSSIILDFIKYKVPFAVIRGNGLSDLEFLSHFPDWMIININNKNDISSLLDHDENEFKEAMEKLRALYWGENTEEELSRAQLVKRLTS